MPPFSTGSGSVSRRRSATRLPDVPRVSARWTGSKVKFDIDSASGHSASIDETGILGNDEAMRPTEMLLGALGGCTGINAVLLLKKFKQPFQSLIVEVEGEQEKEWPKRFTKIDITFVIGWDGKHDRDAVDQALDLACNRYCPIHATIAHGGTEIRHHRKDA